MLVPKCQCIHSKIIPTANSYCSISNYKLPVPQLTYHSLDDRLWQLMQFRCITTDLCMKLLIPCYFTHHSLNFDLPLITEMMLFAVDDGSNDGGFNNDDDDGMVMDCEEVDKMIFVSNRKCCSSVDFEQMMIWTSHQPPK